ncbi:MAG TPA: PBP1A family penicillin-binding protein [Thermoanaerobaculia bacterium]|nr:PBP1A family penicillin-binding protein [Thermoanaerobaculia bacterium]
MQDEPRERRRPAPGVRPRRWRWFRWTWPLAVAVLVGSTVGVSVAALIHVPQVGALATFTPNLVTQLLAVDGSVFASFARERRMMLKEGEIPPLIEQALLASEDSNFFQHGGIDAMGIARAALDDLRAGRMKEGGSTISMQLARTLFLSRERKWRRKIEESLLAVELEKNFSKQQIITLYLNLVNLGHGNYGIEAASRYYFGKPAKAVTLPEAATLIGIIPAPSRYSPYREPDLVLRQRNRVLRRMLSDRFITAEACDKAVAQPVLVASQQPEESFAPYFGEEIRKYLEATYGANMLYEGGLQLQTTLDPRIQRAAEQAVRAGLLHVDHRRGWGGPVAQLDGNAFDTENLPAAFVQGHPVPGRWYQGVVLSADRAVAHVRIGKQEFTLDAKGMAWTGHAHPGDLLRRGMVAWFRFEVPEVKAAKPVKNKQGEAAAPPAAGPGLRLMLEQEPRMEAAGLVIESRTGAIRAMVGGWDFARNRFNRITQARRQVGSAFKPFVYGAALEQGWTPADTLLDAPTSFIGADGKLSYHPENYYHKHYGIVTLRRALEQSINVPAVKLLDLVGGVKVVSFAHRCGIRTPLPTWPSIALGSADLTPLELAASYASIANQGTHIEPYMIERISSPDGQVLEQHFPTAYTATDPAVAYVLTHMLEGVIDRGTAYAVNDLPLDLAGKTGTTDDFTDAWFVGFSPRYTILTWIGYDLKRSLGQGMSGAVAALPMWRGIVEGGLKDGWLQKGETFSAPPGVVFRDVDYYTGLLAGTGSPKVVKEAFVAGTEPAREYSARWSTITTLPWYQQRPFYIPKEGEKMPQTGAPPVPGAKPPALPPNPPPGGEGN